ncbi:hypothetical protein AC578_10921 [Pseudocercospora eumusae]|uniref:Uncharacterized protein n=1 Tax=Pseudocercospora eumusae TaxID=321146 RepID=A0A139GVJ7_9PEZI|nr:hypothetical protein AC578_10921 [Pseudocercospora eumusae]
MPGSSSPGDRKGGRRSFSIFRRSGKRHNSSKYDDVPSESSGDDTRSFHNDGGKKIARPEPLVRSSSDRAYNDWMGAGYESGSPDVSNNTKPLPAQSQASPVLNLFGGYKAGPSGTPSISTPEKASLYDPHRAKEVRRENDGSQVNYSRPSWRNTSPSFRNREYIPYRPDSAESDAPPPVPKDSQPTSDVKEKWVPRALLKAREFGQWDTAWQLEKSFELPHENDDRISQKLRSELEAERVAALKQSQSVNGSAWKSDQTSAWERLGKARHLDGEDRTSSKDFRQSEDSSSSSLDVKSNTTDHTFSSIEQSLAEEKAQKKSLKDAEKLLKQASKKRDTIHKLERRAKDEARSENWTELQVLVAKIDKERTDLVQLDGRIATLQGAHPADDFLGTSTQPEASEKEVPLMMESAKSGISEGAPSRPAPDPDHGAPSLNTISVAPQSQLDPMSSSQMKSGESSSATLSQTFPASHPLAAQEKTLIRDILECEHRISDWIGVVAKAVTSDDVLLKQRAWQYKTNAIPQYTKYVALRRDELEKLRMPQPEPAEDPLELHEPTQLSDIEDGPEHAMGQDSGRGRDIIPDPVELVEKSKTQAGHSKRDTVRWPLLEEKEDPELRKMQPQASMWDDGDSPSEEKSRLNSLDWAMPPTRAQIVEMTTAAAPDIVSIPARRRSKNLTEDQAVRLKESTAALKQPPTPTSPPVFSPDKASSLHRRSKSVSSPVSLRRPSSGTFASGQAPNFAQLDYSSLEKSYHAVLESFKALSSEREYWERKNHKTLTEQLTRTKAELSLTHDQRDYWMRIANEREEEIERLKASLKA